MKKNRIKILILLLILTIIIGYAALSTTLQISGSASIPRVSWDVYFANYQNSQSTNITPTTEPSTPSGAKPTTISYAVTLAKPGDLYEFTVDIVNDGTLDANVNLVSKLNGLEIDENNPIPDYLTYKITDTSDVDIPEEHRLNHATTETIKIKLLFNTDVESSDLPDEETILHLDIELIATQAEKIAAPIVCEEGTYLEADHETCTECEAGYYCPGGEYTRDESQEQGKLGCPENTYSESAATQCTSCPGSMISDPNSTSKSSCVITCSAGKYLAKNQSSCASCISGSYCKGGTYGFNATENQGITECVEGSYTSTSGKSACTPCASGKTTNGAGQTSCNVNCVSDYTINSNTVWKTGVVWNSNNTMTNLCEVASCLNSSCSTSKQPGCNGGLNNCGAFGESNCCCYKNESGSTSCSYTFVH